MKNNLFLTFHITNNCNLSCTYCYEKFKTKKLIKKEYYRDLIDEIIKVLKGEESFLSAYLQPFDNLTLDFIGGEVTLYMEIVTDICDYFTEKLKENNFEEIINSMKIIIESNGTTWKTKEVQDFVSKYKDKLSYGMSLDGCKECHDKCRKFKNGTGSFDIVEAAIKDYQKMFGSTPVSKQVCNRENVHFLKENVQHLYELGYRGRIAISYDIDEEMTLLDSENFFQNLKETIDWIFTEKVEIIPTFLLRNYTPEPRYPNCGLDGSRIDITASGELFNCFLLSETVQKEVTIPIGDIKTKELYIENIKKLRSAISGLETSKFLPDECRNCNIRSQCSACPAEGLKKNGNIEKPYLNCGEAYAMAKATKYWRDRFIFENDYPYFREEFSLQTNNFDENYPYLIKDKK